jgi:hypothetical protein
MYLNEDSATYKSKTEAVQNLIKDALIILNSFGVPLNLTSRRHEKMAIAFLAVADIKTEADFPNAKDQSNSGEHEINPRVGGKGLYYWGSTWSNLQIFARKCPGLVLRNNCN